MHITDFNIHIAALAPAFYLDVSVIRQVNNGFSLNKIKHCFFIEDSFL
jgi:hypothetical protein